MALSSKNPAKQRRAEELDEKTSRFVADIPDRIHTKIRVRCAEKRLDQKEYFLQLLAGDGIK